LANEKLWLADEARLMYHKATMGTSELVQAIFYNDLQPDKILCQGLAFEKLRNISTATEIFNRLIEFGNQISNDSIRIDYFAVS